MTIRHIETEALLERAIDEVRNDAVDPATERRAAERVRRELAAALGAAEDRRPEPAAAHLAGCDDYRSLLPAYLAGELSEARALLLEDHSRECIPCRRVLTEARRTGRIEDPERAASARPERAPTTGRRAWMALAATLVAAVGLASAYLLAGYFSIDEEIARVRSVDGSLYRLTEEGSVALAAGETFAEGDEIRTARDSNAVLTLADGSRIEMRERSQLSLASRRSETTVRIDRGGVIVEAAPQRSGHLYAATEDCVVSVTGTIFSVNHGTKGSRVSVIEGEVRVAQGDDEHVLLPGDQISTRAELARVAIEDEVAWSRNSERYRELLRELQSLGAEMERAFSGTGLRYDSELLDLLPADTAVVVSMPNVADEVAEMQRILDQRLQESDLLRAWWQEKVGSTGIEDHMRDLVERVRGLGEHLGDELIVSLGLDGERQPERPLILAEVVDPAAFAARLADEVAELNAMSDHGNILIVSDLTTDLEPDDDRLLLWLAGDVVAGANDVATLRRLADAMAGGAADRPFTETRFYGHLAESYGHGAQWLVGVDTRSIFAAQLEGDEQRAALEFAGFDNVDALIIERKSDGSETHTGAVLSFDGPRHGAASWLAEPGPMGSLEFVSAEASFVSAFVVDDPASILEQAFGFLEGIAPDVRGQLAAIEEAYGVSLSNDLIGPLGGEVALALDGPALPEPSWKVIAEVYDPAALESGLERAVSRIGNTVIVDGTPMASIERQEVNGRTFYRLSAASDRVEIFYTLTDGYLVAGPSRAIVERAIRIRESRYGLIDSPTFMALLPTDRYLNFSALLYTSLGSLGEALEQTAGLSEEQSELIGQLGSPTLTCAYGESDRIRLVSTSEGGLFGSRLGALLGLGAGGFTDQLETLLEGIPN